MSTPGVRVCRIRMPLGKIRKDFWTKRPTATLTGWALTRVQRCASTSIFVFHGWCFELVTINHRSENEIIRFVVMFLLNVLSAAGTNCNVQVCDWGIYIYSITNWGFWNTKICNVNGVNGWCQPLLGLISRASLLANFSKTTEQN